MNQWTRIYLPSKTMVSKNNKTDKQSLQNQQFSLNRETKLVKLWHWLLILKITLIIKKIKNWCKTLKIDSNSQILIYLDQDLLKTPSLITHNCNIIIKKSLRIRFQEIYQKLVTSNFSARTESSASNKWSFQRFTGLSFFNT